MKIEFNPEEYLDKLLTDFMSNYKFNIFNQELKNMLTASFVQKYINAYKSCTNIQEIKAIDVDVIKSVEKALTVKQEYTGIRDGNKKNPFDDLIDNPLGGPLSKPYNPYYPEITLLPNIPPKYNDIICHNDINMNDANTIKNNITRGTL